MTVWVNYAPKIFACQAKKLVLCPLSFALCWLSENSERNFSLTGEGQRTNDEGLITVSGANLDGSFQSVCVLQNLEAQIFIEIRVISQKFIDYCQRFFVLLPADKGGEPAIDEKDFAAAF